MTTPAIPLTQAQRVTNGTLLLRQYTARFAVACIRKQRDAVCPPEDVENLRWLLCALEALALPGLPPQLLDAPATIPLALGPLMPTSPQVYHLRTAAFVGQLPRVFDDEAKLVLLLEAARRYPLLRQAAAPYQLYGGPRVVAASNGVVYWDDIVGKPDLVTTQALEVRLSQLSTRLTRDIPVLLPAGKSLGHYTGQGTSIPAAGKTVQEVLEDIASETIYPTYQPATILIDSSLPHYGELGEAINGSIFAQWFRGDAGGLLDLRILRLVYSTSVTLKDGPVATQVAPISGLVRSLLGHTFIAQADYQAGARKNVAPSGTPDPRTPLVRQTFAPQAAEQNFTTLPLVLLGAFRIFAGPVDVVPTTSAEIRALPLRPLVPEVSGNSLILETGTLYRRFVVAMPPNTDLTQVLDLSASNADLTAQYVAFPLDVEDMQGDLYPYNVFVMEQAVVYSASHQHKLFFVL